jgi:hypothetical protein
MLIQSGLIRSILLTAAVAGSAFTVGCAEHHYYRAYDPYYSDYHEWNHGEVVYYQQWARESHRDPHRDFRRLRPEEQREYWSWRHGHGDHDRH